MKLLLTASGFTNQSIAQALLDLAGLPTEKIKLVFIPTAANIEEGDKGWLVEDLLNFKKQGYGSIDIVDIASVPKEEWQPLLEMSNVICFGGGSQQYLAKVLNESGVGESLSELLKTRVYVGISAGSMVAGRFASPEGLKLVYPSEQIPDKIEQPLGFVDHIFIPHLNSEHFPYARKEKIESLKKSVKYPIYALDDSSALKIDGDKVEVITEGEYLKI
ncbi:type 1 glutamine amidotransferase-like domain-containing protein [bacterium]|jgi:dipeptidase E|nr:type 1 glutamine amidotransferase-like domain-containing protein [bacterium]MBT3730320.1 type 1 glutamine amidotransferase-like domain-containing protein [bacterium]MBT4894950.1 type 1 glutamine amidotransferase-like domain-containing protein [bacterium]